MSIRRNRNNHQSQEHRESSNRERSKHSGSYSKLLDIYVISVGATVLIKNLMKISFFGITMWVLIEITLWFDDSLRYILNYITDIRASDSVSLEDVLSMLTIIVPSVASLIVAFIKIPEIIAKYLFNIKEDDNMNAVIKNIQDYDKEMFSLEQKVEKALSEQIPQDENLQDESIEELDNSEVEDFHIEDDESHIA